MMLPVHWVIDTAILFAKGTFSLFAPPHAFCSSFSSWRYVITMLPLVGMQILDSKLLGLKSLILRIGLQ